MLLGSHIYEDIYEGKVGALTLLLNSFRGWSKGKHSANKQLVDELAKNDYIFKLGRRSEYRISGGIGKSFIYLVPLKQRGHLCGFRGEYVHLICTGHDRYRSTFAFKVLPKSIIDDFHLKNKTKILFTRPPPGSGDNSEEYLRLTYGDKKKYKILAGRYKIPGKVGDFYDEKKSGYKLPERLRGEKNFRGTDECIVRGELLYFSDEQAIEFDSPGEPNLIKWLVEFRWNSQWEQSTEKMKSEIWKF